MVGGASAQLTGFQSYKWSHPKRAGTLIDRNIFVAKLLLYELSSCLGDVKEVFQALLLSKIATETIWLRGC